MMAPHHERVRALAAVFAEIERVLPAPVETLQETPDILFMANGGGWRVPVSFGYHNALSPSGAPIPGSGHWYAQAGAPELRNPLLALLSWVMKRFRDPQTAGRDRIDQIDAAVDTALEVLGDPIDALAVRGSLVELRSGARSLRVRCHRTARSGPGERRSKAWSAAVEPGRDRRNGQ
jgi:hypothetical protein